MPRFRRSKKQDEFQKILLNSPDNLSPYFVKNGFTALSIAASCLLISALDDAVLSPRNAQILLGSAMALFIICAIQYAFSVLTWRAFRLHRVAFELHLKNKTWTENSCDQLEICITNTLPWKVAIEALRLDHTPHIEIDPPLDPILLPPKSCVSFSCAMRAKMPGPAACIGIAIAAADALHFFRSEAHIEYYLPLDIYPANHSRFEFISRISNKLCRLAQSESPQNSDDENIEFKRYERGDNVRNLHWRTYAKHRELIVRRATCTAPKHLCLCLDTYALDGNTLAPSPTPFDYAKQILEETQSDFQIYSILVLGFAARRYADAVPFQQAYDVLDKALLETLLHKLAPHTPKTPQALQNSPFALALARDLRLYNYVDFTRETSVSPNTNAKNPPKNALSVDLDALFLWYKWFNAERCSKNSSLPIHPQTPQYAFPPIPFETAMTAIASTRKNWPPPQKNALSFRQAYQNLANTIGHDASPDTALVWISPFDFSPIREFLATKQDSHRIFNKFPLKNAFTLCIPAAMDKNHDVKETRGDVEANLRRLEQLGFQNLVP